MDDAELLRRVKAMLETHQDREHLAYWWCAAHSEGQACCLDLILEDDDPVRALLGPPKEGT